MNSVERRAYPLVDAGIGGVPGLAAISAALHAAIGVGDEHDIFVRRIDTNVVAQTTNRPADLEPLPDGFCLDGRDA